MKKVTQWLWLLPAAALLAFSVLCWCGMIGRFADGSVTLRLKKPTPFLQRMDKHTATVSDTWDDVIPERAALSRFDAVATYLADRRISSTQVVRGKDNWLFYMTTADGNTIADYEGTGRYSREVMDSITADALAAQDYLTSQGIRFALLVPPNKENMYAELMPDTYLHKKSRTRLLTGRMRESGVNIVDPREALRGSKADFQLYYSHDTHWNYLGGYVGVREVLAGWDIDLPSLEERSITAIPGAAPNDLAQMLKMEAFFADDAEYVIDELPAVAWDSGTPENALYTNPDALLADKTLLLVGDSFRVAMIPTLRSVFGTIHVIHWFVYQKEMLAQIRPDYVIAESVERYSSTLGDKMRMLGE